LFLGGLLIPVGFVHGQTPKPKEPTWLHGLELRVRKAGEEKFTNDTRKWGIEVFRDENTGNLVYICETGAIAVIPGGSASSGPKPKEPTWLHGMELKVRKTGEEKFSNDTPKFGVEVFKDENTGNLVYICETGSLAVVPGAGAAAGAKSREPTWLHGLELRVRKAGEADFNKDTKRVSLEVFRDENASNIIYISETGAIAVQPPRGTPSPDKAPGPTWLHGLELRVRKAGEADFAKAAKLGLEVFRDDATSHLLYVTETGALGAASVDAPPAAQKTKAPAWLHGLELKVRKAGEEKFTDTTRKYGLEAFKDDNTGLLDYIVETGFTAVVPAK
jgi:hypothetical protein